MTRAIAYTGFLEKELASTDLVEARAAINRLIEEQIKQRMLASVSQEYAFRTVGRALPPDADDFVSPRRLLLVVGGTALGFALGSALALVLAARSRPGGAFAPRTDA